MLNGINRRTDRKIESFVAFTLSEVLITLLIIGVIVSFLIPIIAAYNQTQLDLAFKKQFTVLAQATNEIKDDNGGSLIGAFDSMSAVTNKYAEKLNHTKKCDSTTPEAQYICWSTPVGSGPSYRDIGDEALVLADGAFVLFKRYSETCELAHMSQFNPEPSCTLIQVDVNGLKGPNTLKSDIFHMWVTKTYGLVPTGKPSWMFSKGAMHYNIYPGIDRAGLVLMNE